MSRHIRGTVAELISLQTVVDEIVLETATLQVHAAQAMIGTYPQAPPGILLYRGDTIIHQTVGYLIVFQFLTIKVIAIKTRGSTHPEFAVVFAGNSHRDTIIGTVGAEGLRPTVALDIKTTDAHRCRCIDALTVGRD